MIGFNNEKKWRFGQAAHFTTPLPSFDKTGPYNISNCTSHRILPSYAWKRQFRQRRNTTGLKPGRFTVLPKGLLIYFFMHYNYQTSP